MSTTLHSLPTNADNHDVEVILVYAAADESVAAPIAAFLKGRGATVHVARRLADVERWRYQPVVVLILWTKQSLHSADLYEVARSGTQRMGYVFASGVDAEELPASLLLKEVETASVEDPETLWRVAQYRHVQELDEMEGSLNVREPEIQASMGRRRYSEDRRGSTKEERLEQQAVEVLSGKLVYSVPERMFLREPEEIEIRIGKDGVPRLYDDTVGSAPPTIESLPIVESMSVRIRAKPAEFQIERMSPETQLVGGRYVEALGPEQRQFGEWHFQVTAMKTGVRKLFIEVAGEVHTLDGQTGSRHLKPREYAINVRVSGRLYLHRAMRFGIGLLGALGTGLVGAVTQEMWWPYLRDLFSSLLR